MLRINGVSKYTHDRLLKYGFIGKEFMSERDLYEIILTKGTILQARQNGTIILTNIHTQQKYRIFANMYIEAIIC